MKHVFGFFLVVLLMVSVWLFWLKTPKKGLARNALIFARVFAIVAWLIVLSGMVYIEFCFSLLGDTEDKVLFEQQSPNKFYTVAAFNRIGGATVNNTTVVSIRLKNDRLDTKNNLVVFSEDGIKKVSAIWDGNEHLIIRHDFGEVYTQFTNWNNIGITYIEQ
jgi:hypothetical protein